MTTRVPRRCPAGFTVIELLVVVGIVAILLAFLLPALERARERANNVRCAANLQQIGVGLLVYSNENRGQFPRTAYDPAAPIVYGTNAAAPDPFGAGGPVANDVTAALFLLVRVEHLPAGVFTEPYDDEVQDVPDPTPNPGGRSNFTDYKRNLGYSYADPYPSPAAATAGYGLTNKLPGGFALMACLNPGVAGRNSRNHEGRGQNVLYADLHAAWTDTPKCGLNGDDIYTAAAGGFEAVLLPTDR